MSPSPAAPSKASVMAWSTTSASLWPARPRACGICDPAQHDRAVAGEGVDVEAHAGARRSAARRAIASARSKSAGVVSFSSTGSPSTAATFMPGGAQRPSVSSVGGCARPCCIGVTQVPRAGTPAGSGRGPGRRGRPARRAIRRPGRACRRPAAPAPRPRAFERGEQPVDDRRRAEGAGGVVDQDGVALDRRQAGADAVGALGAADDQLADVEARRAPPRPARSWPSPITTRTASIAGWPTKRFDRPAQHRLAADRPILLGHAAAQALARCRRRRSVQR